MREEFEKLPEIAQALQLIDSFDGYRYYSLNNHRTADWLNGAYYAFQEQQKKIDQVGKLINYAELGYDHHSAEEVLNEIKELLK